MPAGTASFDHSPCPPALPPAAGGFWDVPGFKEEVRRSIAEREQREKTYA